MIVRVGKYLLCALLAPVRVQEIHVKMEKLDAGLGELRERSVRVETIVNRCRHCSPGLVAGDGP